jgi:hypothetical protein
MCEDIPVPIQSSCLQTTIDSYQNAISKIQQSCVINQLNNDDELNNDLRKASDCLAGGHTEPAKYWYVMATYQAYVNAVPRMKIKAESEKMAKKQKQESAENQAEFKKAKAEWEKAELARKQEWAKNQAEFKKAKVEWAESQEWEENQKQKLKKQKQKQNGKK